jgi:phosphoglycolate phosphatase-like HAD superfamily hydrolase
MFDIVWHKHDGVSKASALGILIDHMPEGKNIFIGDREEDWQAAKANEAVFIGAGYGFGGDELAGALYLANDLLEIPALIDKIIKQQ